MERAVETLDLDSLKVQPGVLCGPWHALATSGRLREQASPCNNDGTAHFMGCSVLDILKQRQ